MDQKKTEPKKVKKKKKKKSIGKIILVTLLVLLLLVTAVGTGVAFAVIKSAPKIDVDILNNLQQSSIMYDENNKNLGRVSGGEIRDVVTLDAIPKNLQQAFIAIEDERFYSHGGIDVKRIFGALFNNIKTMSKSQGASTITQQLIKNYALSHEKKYTRKLQEMYLAIQLEKKLSKDQILEAYLNTIYLGGNTYGVKSASMYYFGNKDLKDLSLAECALIAGITKNPSKYDPNRYFNKNGVKEDERQYDPSKLSSGDTPSYIERQHLVLSKMLENGFITQEEYDKAKNETLTFVDKKPKYSGDYHWFVEPALEQVTKDFAAEKNIDEKDARNQLATGGYSIYFTIDTNLQKSVEKVINTTSYYSGIGFKGKDVKNYKDKIQPQASAVVFDYTSGEVKAIVGGRGEHDVGALNRATDVTRQPGSSIKPLSVYSPAIDKGLVTPSSTISGSRLSRREWPGGEKIGNVDGQYPEVTTINKAMEDSRNTVAARLAVKLGMGTSASYLKDKFHLSTIVEGSGANDLAPAALGLGGLTKGVTPYEMAVAYGVFGNNGMYAEPIMYTKVVDREGNIVIDKKSKKTQSISSRASYMTLSMMRNVVLNGTGKSAAFGGMPVAGKTGTTNDETDLWFCGLTPYYSGAVWLGNDKWGTPMTNAKSGRAAALWAGIMREAHKGLPYKNFKTPAGMSEVQVCPESGKLFGDSCRAAGLSPITSMFSSSDVPTEVCNIHTQVIPQEETPVETPQTTPENNPPVTTPGGSTNGGTNNGGGNNGSTNSGGNSGNSGGGSTNGGGNNGGSNSGNGSNNGGGTTEKPEKPDKPEKPEKPDNGNDNSGNQNENQ